MSCILTPVETFKVNHFLSSPTLLKDFLVSPIVDIIAMRRGKRVTDKSSVVSSLTVNPSAVNTIKAITVPLAINVKRQAANMVRNLPLSSPSRGPAGLMIRQTPNKSNLKKQERK